MRALLALVGIAAVVVAILLSLGLLTLKTTPGSLPTVSVNGGAAPSVDANLATVSVGTTNKTIEVPTVTTTEKTITVPTVKMNKPGDVAANSAQ
ncbi:hypothetical protein NDN01_22780 [Sphingomonas sp. QA11]|jgi:hypothetical protein|uniref:Uncharacterized protein n=1 Tax=hydrothermal vent metagenome TaxID=652676 RepID=A0A160TJ70_9ZZZZ|nr:MULTISPECIES: hypothetical protein [unclassified Sphingomonas]WCM26786.1 hypothetical protein NDN01_22780 [Sphingomonas sp. QA11]WEJ98673.1 MAG: hypothetical protein P0Y59_17230 [Sphingomonas sp.]